MKSKPTKLRTRQEGIVSIIVAILVMLLMSLIVLAMAQNSRREQRETVDRQLESKAFYAAESGINDARKYFEDRVADKTIDTVAERTKCSDPLPSDIPSPFMTPLDSNTSYPCLLWDLTPPSIEFGQVKINEAEVANIESADPAVFISELTFEWEAENAPAGGFDFAGCLAPITTFPDSPTYNNPAPPNCDAGILRIDLINTSSGNLNRAALKSTSYVAFFVPQNGGPPSNAAYGAAIGSGNQGKIERGSCNPAATTTKKCQVTITGINLAGTAKMTVVLRSIYTPNSVRITGATVSPVGSPPQAMQFKNGQVLIDSTGKATDVLRRLQVRIPAGSQYSMEPFAIRTEDSLCKLVSIYPPPVPGGYPAGYDPDNC